MAKDSKERLLRTMAKPDTMGYILNGRILERLRPPKALVRILDAILSGQPSVESQCEAAGLDIEAYDKMMKNPKYVAWLSYYVQLNFKMLLGRADMVMLQKAMDGNVQAYRALNQKHFNTAQIKIEHDQARGAASIDDYGHLSTRELKALTKGLAEETGIIDAESIGKAESDDPPEGPGGAKEKTGGGSIPFLQAASGSEDFPPDDEGEPDSSGKDVE